MKRKIGSIVTFLVLLGFVLTYFNAVFKTNNYFNNTLASFNSLPKAYQTDVMIFGSSHAFTTFNPAVLNKFSNTLSFNFGSDGLTVPFTKMVMNKAFKSASPKLVIIEVYPTSIAGPVKEESKGYQLRVIDQTPHLDINKYRTIKKYYPSEELPGVYMPVVRNHSNWHEVDYFNTSRLENIHTGSTYFYNGYRGRNLVLDTIEHSNLKGFDTISNYISNQKVWLDEQGINNLSALINTAQDTGAQVLLVSAPDLRARFFWNTSFIETINNVAMQHGAHYLNLNDYYSEIDLVWTDFRDPSHLNLVGAKKTSEFFADYLNKQYTLPIRSEHLNSIHHDSVYKRFISEFIEFTEKSFRSSVNQSFKPTIVLDSIGIIQKGKNLEFRLHFDPEKVPNSDMDNYKLLVKIHPEQSDFDLISAATLARGWNYDKTDVLLTKKETIAFVFATDIKNIKGLEMLLYNKEKYSGVIGEKVFVNQVEFKD